jgi:hypothetical protein
MRLATTTGLHSRCAWSGPLEFARPACSPRMRSTSAAVDALRPAESLFAFAMRLNKSPFFEAAKRCLPYTIRVLGGLSRAKFEAALPRRTSTNILDTSATDGPARFDRVGSWRLQ